MSYAFKILEIVLYHKYRFVFSFLLISEIEEGILMYVVYNWVDTNSEKKTKIFKQLVFATVLWVRPSFPETYINKSRIEYLHEPSRGFESSGENPLILGEVWSLVSFDLMWFDSMMTKHRNEMAPWQWILKMKVKKVVSCIAGRFFTN